MLLLRYQMTKYLLKNLKQMRKKIIGTFIKPEKIVIYFVKTQSEGLQAFL